MVARAQPVNGDACAFLGSPFNRCPRVDPELPQHVSLAIVTAVPPVRDTFEMRGFMNQLIQFRSILELQDRLVTVVKESDDLYPVEGRTKIVLGTQHAPHYADVEEMFRHGIRVLNPVYSGKTMYGGSHEAPDVGLTHAGRQLIFDCASAGMVVDLAHSGDQLISDVFDLLEQGLPLRVMFSHGGCRQLHHDSRNLSDALMARLARAGGVMGIYDLTFDLSPSDDGLAPFLRHVKHALDVCGTEHVVIGTDGWHTRLPVEEWEKEVEFMRAKFDPDGSRGSRFPDHPYETNTVRHMSVLREALEEDGSLDSSTLERIMGYNLFQFLLKSMS